MLFSCAVGQPQNDVIDPSQPDEELRDKELLRDEARQKILQKVINEGIGKEGDDGKRDILFSELEIGIDWDNRYRSLEVNGMERFIETDVELSKQLKFSDSEVHII